ncbi:MAG: hypothetical protein ACD_3C00100G0004 [uncultured bacterium (gcode 4)]|uniref:SHOCT domain-containing protein n=1 Tax=uncultured bacterium (gcode 4) TaxID=1234023 RepID=K2GD04_9BACT|nr:MAG: hypothetical protein ACD_3C00100G0004 [uncultured bacterium (gcode 4)]
MKQIFVITSILVLSLFSPITTFGQGMMGFPNLSIDDTTIKNQQQEEEEGKKFLDDLNNKTITCEKLTDSDFEKIGEYFMAQSIGDTVRHINMNEMLKRMMGEKWEEQAHSAMGKRLSNCDITATFPEQVGSFWPMMNMMWGWSSYSQSYNINNNPMMWNFWFVWWIFMILLWIVVIVGIFAFIKWFTGQTNNSQSLEISKERYAKGEINKKEFEEMKKDLS